MKKFFRLLVLTISVLMLSVPVFAGNDILVQLNGEIVDFTDSNGYKVEPQIVNDRTMVPMRKIFEVFGAEVTWNGETRSITANTEELEIGLQIDNNLATVKEKNGETKSITLDSAPVIVNDRTLVPVRFIAESLDKKVGWDAENRAVIIIDSTETEEMLKKEASNFYEYLETDFGEIETYKMNIELEGEIKEKYPTSTTLIKIDGDMNISLAKNAVKIDLDLELTGSEEIKEEFGSEELDMELIVDLENKNMYVKSELIENSEGKWVKYELDEEEMAELNTIIESMETQESIGVEALVNSFVTEESLTLNSYNELNENMKILSSIMSNDNFKVSGTEDKTYKFDMDIEDLIEVLGEELSEENKKEIREEAIFGVAFEVKMEDNIAKESSFTFSFGEKQEYYEESIQIKAEGILESYNENINIQIPKDSEIIDIEEIEIEEDNRQDSVYQAAYAGFCSEMGNLQDVVSAAIANAKGEEYIENGKIRTTAQLANFIARGGYSVVKDEASWLTNEEAENVVCTLIEPDYAKLALGIELPNRKVETYNGFENISYYITPKGDVFCWPPYEFGGKSYVTPMITVKDEEENELCDLQATKERKVIIQLNEEEVIVVKNGYEPEFEKGTIDGIANKKL